MPVKIGLENLTKTETSYLRGKRVGLLTNRTGVTANLKYAVDYLRKDRGIELKALFAPEHGFHLNEQAGESVDSYYDDGLGIDVYSIYRQEKNEIAVEPSDTDEKMRSFDTKDSGKFIPDGVASELDAVVMDIQDIGARVYTHVASMANAMQTCRTRGIDFFLFDRPNPINGSDIEGPILLYPEFRSFIGSYSITMRHGMTLGELAKLFNSRLFDGNVSLNVAKMKGWKRTMWYDQTGLPWVLPSPNMPTLDTATVYPGQVMLEGTNVSEGRGTTKPFEIIGARWLDGYRFAGDINSMKQDGVKVNEIRFTPTFSKYQGVLCQGIEIHVTDRRKFKPFRFTLNLLDWLLRNYQEDFEFHNNYFDKAAGNSYVRKMLFAGEIRDLFEKLKSEEISFEETRKEFLIY